MKANEFIDGIYVYFNCFDGSKITVKVTGFKDDIVYGVSKHGTHWCQISKIEPIPLTPDILEKNGFVVESRHCLGNPLQYCVLVDGLWIDITGENYFEGKLEYAHQLQHALRLCGIEKEIIL